MLPPESSDVMVSPNEFNSLIKSKLQFQNMLSNFLHNYDAWLVPVAATNAIPHNSNHNPIKVNNNNISYWRALIHYCRVFSLTGNPVLVIPIGFTSNNLPFGVQLVGKINQDEQLIAIAKVLEKMIPQLNFPSKYQKY